MATRCDSIAFITTGDEVNKILDHLGMTSPPPRVTPARRPPLWDQQDVADTYGADEQANLVPASPDNSSISAPTGDERW